MGGANDWVHGLMDRVGASYGYVSKQTRVSKPDSRIYEQKSEEVTKMQGWGNDYLPIYIYIYRGLRNYQCQLEVSFRYMI